jgi:hypothetical protein
MRGKREDSVGWNTKPSGYQAGFWASGSYKTVRLAFQNQQIQVTKRVTSGQVWQELSRRDNRLLEFEEMIMPVEPATGSRRGDQDRNRQIG